VKVETLTASTVDFDELAQLQRKSFEGVADPGQLEDVQTPEYYRWKYTLAGGEARIAQIRNDSGELVAMNSAFPLTLTNGDRTTRGWQSCDTATHPSARGKGYFLKCLSALKETFTEGEVFFGYPNANSTRGFTKFGWQKISTLQPFAGIIPPLSTPSNIRRVDRFGPEQDNLARRLAGSGRIMIQRSAAYMNDRYCSPQRPLYTSFIYEDAGEGFQGFVVARPLAIYGMSLCLVVDCQATTRRIERQLLSQIGRWGREQRHFLTLTINSVSKPLSLASSGLMPIPNRLSPRPLILMGQAIGSTAQAFIDHRWAAYVGDWDGF
jgi:hypothetical protein